MPRSRPPVTMPPASGLECPACGAVVVHRDFCTCGEYLAWELTIASEAPPPTPEEPAVHRPPAPVAPRASTLLTLRDPERDDDPSAKVSVSVVPGADVVVLATLRNQGEIVDTFDVRVDGLHGSWWTVTPATVFLNPWGSSGDYEQTLQLRLHPPKTPESVARDWPLTIVARSRSLGADVAWVAATLTVQPFQSTVMSVGPERRRGRRHAAFEVVVGNHGNSPMEIVIGAQDSEARCPVTVTPGRTTVAVGQYATAVVRVGVPKPLIFGRPVDHHLDVTHRATGVESDPAPQRVTFRQRPWLPWWVPAVLALTAAFAAAILLLRSEPEVPKLTGETVEHALVVLDRHHLKLGDIKYVTAPKDVELNTIVGQQPAAGDEIVKGERVSVTLAAPPKTGLVPPVNGQTLAEAADALTAAGFAYSPQPPSAGNDWVVIRQDPTPGTKRELGQPVTLAVEARTPAATPTPAVTPTPTAAATATPKAESAAKPAGAKAAAASKPKSKPQPSATASAKAKPLPADLVFAGATSGQLYRWARSGAKATRLTSPKLFFETPVPTDDGYVAVQVSDDARRLVRISADGKTVDPIADGDYRSPAYSAHRGLLAVISGDAGRLCVLDPREAGAPACASRAGVSGPAWAPDGRSVLAVATDGLLGFAAKGGDATRWDARSVYRAAGIQSAAWVGDDRVAVLVADNPAKAPHLRLLARRANGTFKRVKDFPALTGYELAATGHHLALRRGAEANGDGAMVLLDVDRARPRVRGLTSGVSPAWAG